jgi:phosphoglycerol transferase MdoB-like AlkP superfamily enzyme
MLSYIFERSAGTITFAVSIPMKQIARSFLMQLLFWILFFDLARLVFLLYYTGLLRAGHIGPGDVAGVFIHSIRLDLAVACYFMVFPFLILSVQSFWSPRWLNQVNKAYTGLIIFVYSLTAAGEMGIYREWQTKISFKALKYLAHPSEVYNSAETGTFFLLLVILLALTFTGIVAYLKLFYRDLYHVKRNLWFTLGLVLFMPGMLFLGFRGGIQEIPINQSESYYSKHEVLNHVAVNNVFNLFVSIFENYRVMDRNPYVFMEQKKAERIVKQIFRVEKDTTVSILTNKRPNIVMIILESYSADLIESLGAKPGITPEFSKLQQEGILFTRIYSSGMRSEQGMAALFGGFPSHPVSCSVVQPDKYHALPRMPWILKESGYRTSYYFGGQLIYGNIKGYIYYNEFERIMEGPDFPFSLPRGKLGIHDGYMLDILAKDLDTNQQPFFAVLATLSSHSPFDQPYEKPLKWGDSENDYINSAYYTDHCLGEFFRKVKNQPWFKNTLFILVADHSHRSYYNWNPGQKEYRRIPILFLGDVIAKEYRGTTWDKLGNHHDLPATLLAQLGIPYDSFPWSRNLLNPQTPAFAYFSNENGFGWLRPGIEVSYDIGKEWPYAFTVPPEIKDSIVSEGEAYLQVLFSRYLSQ